MAHTEQRTVRRIATWALTIVTIAVALVWLVSSAPASGATHTGKAKHAAKVKCRSHTARHAKHRRSAHASRKQKRHAKANRCARRRGQSASKRKTAGKRKTAAGVTAPAKTVTNPGASSAAAGPQTTWTPVGTLPLSDAQAAALVTPESEQRPENAAANDYVPTAEQVASFHAQADSETPLNKYVDGLDGMTKPSTDDLIQWGAHKWGIPEEWLKAEYFRESEWHQTPIAYGEGLGDAAEVSPEWYAQYPAAARIAPFKVYESMGITQLKWKPADEQYPGTEPLRWESTAFNIDFQAAQVRAFYDGDCGWCGAGYGAGQQWNSIGAWFAPTPWANAEAESYIASVQKILAEKPWLSPSF